MSTKYQALYQLLPLCILVFRAQDRS